MLVTEKKCEDVATVEKTEDSGKVIDEGEMETVSDGEGE